MESWEGKLDFEKVGADMNKTCSGHRIASSADLDKTQARLLNEFRHFRWAENTEADGGHRA